MRSHYYLWTIINEDGQNNAALPQTGPLDCLNAYTSHRLCKGRGRICLHSGILAGVSGKSSNLTSTPFLVMLITVAASFCPPSRDLREQKWLAQTKAWFFIIISLKLRWRFQLSMTTVKTNAVARQSQSSLAVPIKMLQNHHRSGDVNLVLGFIGFQSHSLELSTVYGTLAQFPSCSAFSSFGAKHNVSAVIFCISAMQGSEQADKAPSCIHTAHKDFIHDVSFDYYGKRLATCSSDQKIHVRRDCDAVMWDNFSQIWEISPEGTWELSATITVCWWRCHSCAQLSQGHCGPVYRVAWAHPEFGQVRGYLCICAYNYFALIGHCNMLIWQECVYFSRTRYLRHANV